MWTFLHDTIIDRASHGGVSIIKKAKAHLDKAAILFNRAVNPTQLIENCLADGAADQGAAELNRITNGYEEVIADTKRCKAIVLRLAVIKAHVWRHGQNLKCYDDPRTFRGTVSPEPKALLEDFEAKIADKQHDLVRDGRFMRCRGCGRKRSARCSSFWLSSPCDHAVRKRTVHLMRGYLPPPPVPLPQERPESEGIPFPPPPPEAPQPQSKRRKIATKLFRVSEVRLNRVAQGGGYIGVNNKAGAINFIPANGSAPYPLVHDIDEITPLCRDGFVVFQTEYSEVGAVQLVHANDEEALIISIKGKQPTPMEAIVDSEDLEVLIPVPAEPTVTSRRFRPLMPAASNFGTAFVEWNHHPTIRSAAAKSLAGPSAQPRKPGPGVPQQRHDLYTLLKAAGTPGQTQHEVRTRTVRRRLNSKQPEQGNPNDQVVEHLWVAGETIYEEVRAVPPSTRSLPAWPDRPSYRPEAAPAIWDEAEADDFMGEDNFPDVGQGEDLLDDLPEEHEGEQQEQAGQELMTYSDAKRVREALRKSAAEARQRKRQVESSVWAHYASTTPVQTKQESYGIPIKAQPVPPVHYSHDIYRAGTSKVLVFCMRCTCWATDGPLRSLAVQCQVPPDGRNGARKLLSLGIPPVPGARLPPNARVKRRRR